MVNDKSLQNFEKPRLTLINLLCPYIENAEPPPKTYVVKDKFEYFKPCVQVEMENYDKPETVTEIYIRGKNKNNAKYIDS